MRPAINPLLGGGQFEQSDFSWPLKITPYSTKIMYHLGDLGKVQKLIVIYSNVMIPEIKKEMILFAARRMWWSSMKFGYPPVQVQDKSKLFVQLYNKLAVPTSFEMLSKDD